MLFQRICAFFMALSSVILAFFGIEKPLGKETDTFRVTSYVVASSAQSPDAFHSEDFDIITNVIIFGVATFDNDGSVSVDKTMLETVLQNLKSAIGDRDITVTLNFLGPQRYGDATDYYEQMEYQAALHSEAFRSGVLEDNIINIINEYELDGVHFDYEYPVSNKAWRDFNIFLVGIKEKMPDKKLGVAVSEWDMGLNTKAMQSVDYIELMLYDNYDDEGRHAPSDVCYELAKNTALKGMPLEKVNFGLPFYARPTDHGAYWYGYNGYYDQLDENGFYYDQSIDKNFWFNTPDVISEKTEFAKENGFGGVMIWHYSCDLPSTNENSLLRAIGKTIG
ncbi:MAG: glycoside hydrolase family 18 protein [Clostridia bacterium]|nr:glycoside hydrolase family 18 protein [Clostridia bacterium]